LSVLNRDVGKSVVLMGGMGYFVLLAVALIWFHFPPDLIFALTAGMIALGAMSLNPLLGIHAFLAMLYVENAIPTGEGLTGMKVLGVVILAGWLLSAALQRKIPLHMENLTVLAVLFVIWTGFSVTYAIYSEPALNRVFTFAQLATISLMVSSVVDTPAKIRGVYWAIVLWSFLSTLLAIAWYYMGVTPVAVGLIGNRNGLAGAINVAIVCAYLLHQATESRPARLFLASTLPVFFLGLALTFSRAGMIMLLVALLCVWYRVLLEKKLLVLVASMIMLCIITLVLPHTFWVRAGTILPAIERQEGTFGVRVELWRVAMKMIEDRPLTGVGPGNFSLAFARYARGEMMTKNLDAHNTYLSVASQMGLVGLGLFLLIEVHALVQAFRASRAGRESGLRDLELFALVLMICLVLAMTGSLVSSVESNKSLWIFFGLAASLSRMARKMTLEARRPIREGFEEVRREDSGAWSMTPSK
jgi:O-antigen ligase